MKTQNETHCATFFPCKFEWGSCSSYHCCGLTYVFPFRHGHIHYYQTVEFLLWAALLLESDLTMACFLSKYTLWERYYACYKVNELHFLITIAIRLTGTGGKGNQQAQSTTDGSKISCLLDSPLQMTTGKVQHLRYLFPVEYQRKNIQVTIRCSQESLL